MDSSLCTIVAGAAYSSALYAKLLVGWELTQAGQDDMLEMVANLQQVRAPRKAFTADSTACTAVCETTSWFCMRVVDLNLSRLSAGDNVPGAAAESAAECNGCDWARPELLGSCQCIYSGQLF